MYDRDYASDTGETIRTRTQIHSPFEHVRKSSRHSNMNANPVAFWTQTQAYLNEYLPNEKGKFDLGKRIEMMKMKNDDLLFTDFAWIFIWWFEEHTKVLITATS